MPCNLLDDPLDAGFAADLGEAQPQHHVPEGAFASDDMRSVSARRRARWNVRGIHRAYFVDPVRESFSMSCLPQTSRRGSSRRPRSVSMKYVRVCWSCLERRLGSVSKDQECDHHQRCNSGFATSHAPSLNERAQSTHLRCDHHHLIDEFHDHKVRWRPIDCTGECLRRHHRARHALRSEPFQPDTRVARSNALRGIRPQARWRAWCLRI